MVGIGIGICGDRDIPFVYDLRPVSMSLHASVRHFNVFRLYQHWCLDEEYTWKAWDVVTNEVRRRM